VSGVGAAGIAERRRRRRQRRRWRPGPESRAVDTLPLTSPAGRGPRASSPRWPRGPRVGRRGVVGVGRSRAEESSDRSARRSAWWASTGAQQSGTSGRADLEPSRSSPTGGFVPALHPDPRLAWARGSPTASSRAMQPITGVDPASEHPSCSGPLAPSTQVSRHKNAIGESGGARSPAAKCAGTGTRGFLGRTQVGQAASWMGCEPGSVCRRPCDWPG
jgi:hypothetical protein